MGNTKNSKDPASWLIRNILEGFIGSYTVADYRAADSVESNLYRGVTNENLGRVLWTGLSISEAWDACANLVINYPESKKWVYHRKRGGWLVICPKKPKN